MIERIVEWAKWQEVSFDDVARMCAEWASDPEYWEAKPLWQLHDLVSSRP